MKSRMIFMPLLFVLCFCYHWGNAEELYLSLCNDPGQWWLHLGRETPGAVGKIAAVKEEERGECLRIDYDFRKGGQMGKGDIVNYSNLLFPKYIVCTISPAWTFPFIQPLSRLRDT